MNWKGNKADDHTRQKNKIEKRLLPQNSKINLSLNQNQVVMEPEQGSIPSENDVLSGEVRDSSHTLLLHEFCLTCLPSQTASGWAQHCTANQKDHHMLEKAHAVQHSEDQNLAPGAKKALAGVYAGGHSAVKQLCTYLGSWWTPS